MPDFNDATKLGSGKEMVERLTNLIAIFENPALDFSKNRAKGDDILGEGFVQVHALHPRFAPCLVYAHTSCPVKGFEELVARSVCL